MTVEEIKEAAETVMALREGKEVPDELFQKYKDVIILEFGLFDRVYSDHIFPE